MKVRIEYTTEVPDDYRRAINLHWGREGLASREDVKQWYKTYGTSMDDNLMIELETYEAEVREARFSAVSE